jgi:DNA-binding transcriptional LysR family regulator
MALDNRISLYKLEVFDLVVELGSVSRAADHLFVSQPVVTAHIRSLEERIGARLFYREGRQLVMTEAGTVAHAWARDILTRTRELSRRLDGLSDGTRGAVVVGASMSTGSYLLPPILSRFRQERPLAEIKCYISDSEHAMEGVEAGQNDFAVVILETGPGREGLEAEHLREEQFVVAAAPDFELPGEPISLADLARLPMVESPTGLIRRTLLDRQLEKLGIRKRNVVIELGHPEAMKAAARRGLGVTLQFRSAVRDDVEAGRLRAVEIADASLSVPVFLISRKGKFLSAIQRDLMDDIRREVRGDAAAAA